MTDFIYSDWIHFCQAVTWGVILAAAYDLIRIFRRVVHHRKMWSTALEDILFWMAAGVAVFALAFQTSSGVIRGFLLCGTIAGAAMYKYTFSELLVRAFSKLLNFVVKVLMFPLKKCRESVKIIVKAAGKWFRKHFRGKDNGGKKDTGKQKKHSDEAEKTKAL